MGVIAIENMEFFSYHGCFTEEQIIGNRFRVDLEFTTNTSKSEVSDQLADTVNYQDVYGLVADEMQKKSKLLEHVAARVIQRIMEKYSEIKHLKIKLSKFNPPIGGKVGSVSFTMEKTRN